MAFYNLKKKPALTTKEGETETMYADIVYSGTIPAERLIRGVAKRTGFKEGVIEGILIELKEFPCFQEYACRYSRRFGAQKVCRFQHFA